MEPFITVVSGLPRSGTSMVMRMLAAGGMDIVTDRARTPDEDNPRGYFEDGRVCDLARDASWLHEARGRAVKVISHLLGHLPPAERYRVVFVHRDLAEVLASQRTMLERRGVAAGGPGDEVIAGKFARHLDDVERWLATQKHIACLNVRYDEVVAAPHEAAERIAAFIGAGLDADAMAAAVDPSLYRNRHT